MTCVDLSHSAAADQPIDLVPPAQQASCAVHYVPFLSASLSLMSLCLKSRHVTSLCLMYLGVMLAFFMSLPLMPLFVLSRPSRLLRRSTDEVSDEDRGGVTLAVLP